MCLEMKVTYRCMVHSKISGFVFIFRVLFLVRGDLYALLDRKLWTFDCFKDSNSSGMSGIYIFSFVICYRVLLTHGLPIMRCLVVYN